MYIAVNIEKDKLRNCSFLNRSSFSVATVKLVYNVTASRRHLIDTHGSC